MVWPGAATCACDSTWHATARGARRVPPLLLPSRFLPSLDPTTHPGSFRCSLHKGLQLHPLHHHNHAAFSPSHWLNARRSAMTNLLVRIGTVEGEWVKRALTALIRPSSHPLPTSSASGQRSSHGRAASPSCPRPAICDLNPILDLDLEAAASVRSSRSFVSHGFISLPPSAPFSLSPLFTGAATVGFHG